MVAIGDILVSDDVVSEEFVCNLKVCKGACCREGDFGAPISENEKQILEDIYQSIKPFLSDEGRHILEMKGPYTYYGKVDEWGTPLMENEACAYMTYNDLGFAQCGIEKAFLAGATSFVKPISCHLYPIRVQREIAGYEWLNYEKWSICSAACTLGKELKIPVFQFVKDALIRQYGEPFYEELNAYYETHFQTPSP
jgi:hypothetical protein